MKPIHRLLSVTTALSVAILLVSRGATQQDDDPDLPPPNFSVETRGPVHEAFAQPNEGKPIQNEAVPKEPPPPLPEQQPEQRPDNPNLEWIPGYWSWDAERNDFIWVTGTFRDSPPGRRWVPGYWNNTADGWRWIAGFWANENQQELRYTPEPPAPLEEGPQLPAPDANSTYVPGYWYYYQPEQRFSWRPGYWAPYRDGRAWVSPQYYWTPGGYAFNDGYWDFPLEDRGMLFAPAYFPTPLWATPGWSYRPRFVVSIGLFFNSGFYGPGFNSFYFGNYYGNRYAGLGYRPWWGGPRNSNYNYYAWQNRNNPQLVAQQQQLYRSRQAGQAPLPPANFAQQRAQLAAAKNATPAVTPISRTSGTKFVPNNGGVQTPRVQNIQDIAKLRANAERTMGGTAKQANVKLPAAPPVVRPLGTQSSAAKAGIPTPPAFAKTVGQPDIGGGQRSTPAINPQPQQPRPFANPGPGAPKVAGPTPNLPQPANIPQPRPRANPTPPSTSNVPRASGPTPQPNPVVPKQNVAKPSNPTPNLPQPANLPQPRPIANPTPPPTLNGPRVSAPPPQLNPVVPRQNIAPPSNPAPRTNLAPSPAPAPRQFSSPAPQPTPRQISPPPNFSRPPSAPQSSPRFSAPAPRSSPSPSFSRPSAPAGGGGARISGGGAKGGGKR